MTFISVTASLEAFYKMPYVWYPVQFQEGQTKVKALIDFGSEVNAMTLAYTAQLGLTTWKTSIGAQKINGLPLETYKMVSASFLLQDSLGRARFFDKTFLLANTSIEVVLKMPFLAFNNADF